MILISFPKHFCSGVSTLTLYQLPVSVLCDMIHLRSLNGKGLIIIQETSSIERWWGQWEDTHTLGSRKVSQCSFRKSTAGEYSGACLREKGNHKKPAPCTVSLGGHSESDTMRRMRGGNNL